MKRTLAIFMASFILLIATAMPANALTVYPSNGYYSWNGVWYCYRDYTFWDRLWNLNARLLDGYYKCPYPRGYYV